MKKNEAECCDVICIHSDRVEKVRESMPKDSLLSELADFYKVFGDTTRIRILPLKEGKNNEYSYFRSSQSEKIL